MREWERLRQKREVSWGAHNVEYDEIHNLWRCRQCKSKGTVVMNAVFLQVMRQPCVHKDPAGKSTYHKNRMGKLQLDVMARKWNEAELARETGGVRPVVGSGKILEWVTLRPFGPSLRPWAPASRALCKCIVL